MTLNKITPITLQNDTLKDTQNIQQNDTKQSDTKNTQHNDSLSGIQNNQLNET
jgi:hypothetical protein